MKSTSAIERKTFSVGHCVYRLSKLNWTPLPSQIRKYPHIPSRRYLHTATAHAGKLYVFGGVDNDSPIRQTRLYVMDIATLKWTTIEGRIFCEGRNSHSCTLFRNQIYFFGGSQVESNPTNSFFKFTPTTCSWTLIENDQLTPAERQLAVFTSVGDQFIVLYGGIDMIKDHIFQDAYLWMDQKWQRLHVTQNLSERIGMGVAICGMRVFIFGGEGPSESSPVLFNNLYEFRINSTDLQARFVEIPVLAGKLPQKRTAHGMAAVSSQFFLIYGGEGMDDKGGSVALADIWIFDTRERVWTEIQTIYGTITPRYEFSMVVHNNEIFMFGGFDEHHSVLDSFTKLEFLQDEPRIQQFCLSCEETNIKNVKQAIGTRQLSISTGFLYNLAMEISFPFKAVELVFDAAEMMGAELIRFFSRKTMQDFDYFVFEFSAAFPLSPQKFLDMTKTNGDSREVRIAHNLQIGAFRLGKTFIFVSVHDSMRSVFLCSVDGKFAPNFQDRAAHYSYIQDLQSGMVFPEGGQGIKQTIYNILRTQLLDPELILSRKSGQALLIFQVNILPTVEKAYYYELIFYNTPEGDVKRYSNQNRGELLQKLGYCLVQSPQFSLRSYLSISRIERPIRLLLNNDETSVQTINYLSVIRSYQMMGQLQQIQEKLVHPMVVSSVLFRCTQSQFLPYNQGVLLYCGGRLVDRYSCSFGELLCSKFYKRKYRNKINLFKYLGVVQLSQELQLNFNRTKFRNIHKYKEILQELTSKLKSHKGEGEQGLGQLYDLKFGLGQSSKRLKRDAHNDTR